MTVDTGCVLYKGKSKIVHIVVIVLDLHKKIKLKNSSLTDIDRFYIPLFSALEQTHCALVACDSK